MTVLSDISIRDLCTGEFITRWTEPVEWDMRGNVKTEIFGSCATTPANR